MQVLGDKQNPVPLLAPAICMICEHNPTQQAGERIIDTERTFIPMGPPTRLNGRKYVCDGCVKEMARAIGMEFSSEGVRARQEFDTYRQSVAILQARIEDFANDVKHAVQFVPSSSAVSLVQAASVEEPVAEQRAQEDAAPQEEVQ